MKEIQLTQGKVATVDDCDFALVSKYKWSAQKHYHSDHLYYAACCPGRRATRKAIRMHRLILGVKKGEAVDHIDGNGLNNQRSNLRISTQRENSCNRQLNRNNSTGFKGIWKQKGRFRAGIKVNWINRCIGSFKTAREAAMAYDAAAIKYFGEFAKTNAKLGLLCQ